jgi:immune inhibitor A
MKNGLILIFVAVLSIIGLTFSVPANKTPITIKQPNGKTLTYILQGDERISWAKTLDNYSLLYNKKGYLVYAVLDKNSDMVPSDVLACNQEERSKEELDFLSNIKKDLFFSQKQFDQKTSLWVEKSNPNQEELKSNKEKPKKRCCIFGRRKAKE